MAQKTAKVDTTQNKVNEALCECIGKQDLSKITTREQAAAIFDNCIIQNGALIFKLAGERNVDVNDRQALLELARNLGGQLREQFCFAAEEFFLKVSDIVASPQNRKIAQDKRFQDSIYIIGIRRDGEAMIKVIVNDDMEGLIKYLYPPMVEKNGGATQMIETLKMGNTRIKDAGVTITNASIDEPYEITKGTKNIYAFVPGKTVADVKGEPRVITSTFLAVSTNDGKNWFFIDMAGLHQEEASKMFPDLGKKLIFPEKSAPTSLPK